MNQKMQILSGDFHHIKVNRKKRLKSYMAILSEELDLYKALPYSIGGKALLALNGVNAVKEDSKYYVVGGDYS